MTGSGYPQNAHRVLLRRNGAVAAASAVTIGLLFLYPASVNATGSHRRPVQAIAPAGILADPPTTATPTASPARRGGGAANPAGSRTGKAGPASRPRVAITTDGTHRTAPPMPTPLPTLEPIPKSKPTPTPTPTPTRFTVNGAAAESGYGPVQVQLVIRGTRIVSATAIDYPQENGRDQRINSHAIPILQQETITAQSRHIDTISGATYTSAAYKQSLQSALDAAHL